MNVNNAASKCWVQGAEVSEEHSIPQEKGSHWVLQTLLLLAVQTGPGCLSFESGPSIV